MIVLTYCRTDASSIETSLGGADYSYYFVFKQYLRALRKIATVIDVGDSIDKISFYYSTSLARGEECVCLVFSPPHKIDERIQCPIIPVFAWEYDALPNNLLGGQEQDWRWCLAKQGWAITHSEYAVTGVKNAIRSDFPVVSIPSPVWDESQAYVRAQAPAMPKSFRLGYSGFVLDSAQIDLTAFAPDLWQDSILGVLERSTEKSDVDIEVSGVVYLSVFNPDDLRKNWSDMLRAFCWQFKDVADVTLVWKITHTDVQPFLRAFMREIFRLSDFSCRVIVVHGYLDDDAYARLIKNSDFVVNASHGEGQCLPLMEGMSAGKPAISPIHTGMADYVTAENSFIVASDVEPGFWPHDPRQSLRTFQYRIDWGSLCRAFDASYLLIKDRPEDYKQMSLAVRESMRLHCSVEVVAGKLKQFLAMRAQGYRVYDREWAAQSYTILQRLLQKTRPLKRKLFGANHIKENV